MIPDEFKQLVLVKKEIKQYMLLKNIKHKHIQF